MNGGLKIGELARRAGVTPKAIRFYERRGILPAAKRAANRYRLYGDDAAETLRFVKQAGGLGLTLAVHQLLSDKAVELDRKLKDLVDVRARIRRSLSAWNRQPQKRAPV
jgi:DNA-binding transcriptional MerR regulator